MATSNSQRGQRKRARVDPQLASGRAMSRKTALLVAALVVVALLAPFVVFHLAG